MGSQDGYVTPMGRGGGTAPVVTFAGNLDSAFATAFMKLVRNGQITISSQAVA